MSLVVQRGSNNVRWVVFAKVLLVSAGRPIASFARFLTVDVDPTDAKNAVAPAACELSREVRRICDFLSLSQSPLPFSVLWHSLIP